MMGLRDIRDARRGFADRLFGDQRDQSIKRCVQLAQCRCVG